LATTPCVKPYCRKFQCSPARSPRGGQTQESQDAKSRSTHLGIPRLADRDVWTMLSLLRTCVHVRYALDEVCGSRCPRWGGSGALSHDTPQGVNHPTLLWHALFRSLWSVAAMKYERLLQRQLHPQPHARLLPSFPCCGEPNAGDRERCPRKGPRSQRKLLGRELAQPRSHGGGECIEEHRGRLAGSRGKRDSKRPRSVGQCRWREVKDASLHRNGCSWRESSPVTLPGV